MEVDILIFVVDFHDFACLYNVLICYLSEISHPSLFYFCDSILVTYIY